MRNVFDQYSQQENRLTHALVSALAEDRKLLRDFVHWTTGRKFSKSRFIEIVEQTLPGEDEVGEGDTEKKGLPDAWIHDGEEWSLLIENKVALDLSVDQLRRHLRTAEQRGYKDIHLLALSVKKPKWNLPDRVTHLEWKDVYRWLNDIAPKSEWAARTAEYVEIAESKWSEEGYLKEGTLTVFNGIPFADGSYTYVEAKRIIRLAMDELQSRKVLQKKLGIDPKGERRGAIRGTKGDMVWDLMPIKAMDGSDRFPHFDLYIRKDEMKVMMTIPNRAKRSCWKNLIDLGEDGFRDLLVDFSKVISTELKGTGGFPWVALDQRHYESQSGPVFQDATLAFNPQTAVRRKAKSKRPETKFQPHWVSALYQSISEKESHMEIAFGARFQYRVCKRLNRHSVLDDIQASWLACKPILDCALGKRR